MIRLVSILALLLTFVAWSTATLSCTIQSYSSACALGKIASVTLDGTGRVSQCNWAGPVPKASLATPPTAIALVSPLPNGISQARLYTIIMFDPDYKSPPSVGKPDLLWLLTNVPVTDAFTFNLAQGAPLAAYRPPNYSRNGYPHRIVILVFEQAVSQIFPASYSVYDFERKYFRLASWLYRSRQYVTCTPVAGFQLVS